MVLLLPFSFFLFLFYFLSFFFLSVFLTFFLCSFYQALSSCSSFLIFLDSPVMLSFLSLASGVIGKWVSPKGQIIHFSCPRAVLVFQWRPRPRYNQIIFCPHKLFSARNFSSILTLKAIFSKVWKPWLSRNLLRDQTNWILKALSP